jgi:hypothetical protein
VGASFDLGVQAVERIGRVDLRRVRWAKVMERELDSAALARSLSGDAALGEVPLNALVAAAPAAP